jgi:hypothetical protein
MVNPVALLGMMPKIEGFAPLPAASAAAFMEYQTKIMMLSGGVSWAAGQRFIKAMSNDEFNQMMGTASYLKVDGNTNINNVITAQQKEIKDGLWKKIQPLLESARETLEKNIDNSDKLQHKIIEKAFDLEMAKVQFNMKLLRELPKEYFREIGNILAGQEVGTGSDYAPEEDRGLQDETKHPDRYKPKDTPKETPKETTPRVRIQITYKAWVKQPNKFWAQKNTTSSWTDTKAGHYKRIKAMSRNIQSILEVYKSLLKRLSPNSAGALIYKYRAYTATAQLGAYTKAVQARFS